MDINVRDAKYEDMEGIIELCSLIWDGDDYVPDLLDKWFFSGDPFVIAEDSGNGKIVGIDHAMIQRNIAWLEGLRVHPQYRGNGISEMLFREILKKIVLRRIIKMRSMIWNGNGISKHLSEKHHFSKVMTYYLLNLDLKKTKFENCEERNMIVEDVFPSNMYNIIGYFEDYFNACLRKYPDGWVEYEDSFFLGNRIVVRKDDSGLLCGISAREKGVFNINLVRYGKALYQCISKAVEFAKKSGCDNVQVNIPVNLKSLVREFLEFGFEYLDYSENDSTVSVYEYDPSHADRKCFSGQMGIKIQNLDNYFGTAMRCSFGFPQVVESFPVKNERPFPTLFYLSCPYLVYHVSQLEEKGLIDIFEEENMPLYEEAHALYKKIRKQILNSSYGFSDVYGRYSGAYDKGIGGIENSRSLKCLHLQLATTLGGIRTEAGIKVADILNNSGIGLECSNCECLRFL